MCSKMKMMQRSCSITKNRHFRFIILFCIVTLSFIYKLNKGFPSFDEGLYVALPWRFLNGDYMFQDELMGMQMSSFLLLPFMKLFLIMRPNMDYVILFFRWLYFFFQILICLSAYWLLNKKVQEADIICILFYAFVPFGLMSLSYTTIPLSLLFLISAIILSEQIDKPFFSILVGVFQAFIILCQPGCMLIFFVWFFLVVIKPSRTGIFSRKNFAFATSASFFVCVAFFAYLLQRLNVQDIIASFGLMSGDTEHLADNMLLNRIFFIDALYWFKREHVFTFLFGWIAIFVVDFAVMRGNWRKDGNFLWIDICMFLAGVFVSSKYLFYQAFVLSKQIGMSAIVSPLAPIGLYCWLHISAETRERNSKYMLVWILSFMYMYCNHLLSNNTPHVMSLGCMMASFVSIPMIRLYLNEKFENTVLNWSAMLSLVLICQFCAEGIVFFNNVFVDESITELTYYVDCGPAKGIYTSRDNYINYVYTLKDLDKVKEMTDEDDLIYIDMEMLLEGGPIYYMYMNNRISPPIAYSGYELFEAGTVLDAFYEANPEKLPDVVFIPDMVMNKESTKIREEEIQYVSEKYNMIKYSVDNASIALVKND